MGEVMPRVPVSWWKAGVEVTKTPAARARSLSPVAMLRQARCSATSEDEQAVSIVMLGPRRSNTYEMRFAAMLPVLPVIVVASTEPRSSARR